MASKNVLKRALQEFEGAIVLVSHDRDFLRDLVGKCFDFRNRKIREYIGGIDDYLRYHGSESVDDVFGPRSASPEGKKGDDGDQSGVSRKEQKRREAELRNKRYAATKELKEKLAVVEKRVEKLEEEKTLCEDQLADPEVYSDGPRAAEVQKRLKEIQSELSDLYGRWERAAADLEQAEAEFEES